MTIRVLRCLFFFNDTATTEIYTLSLHDALPILRLVCTVTSWSVGGGTPSNSLRSPPRKRRSEEHTSELQSQSNLVCRLLLVTKVRIPPVNSKKIESV